MRILYGVQATGQGHISRARAMARALARHPVEVTWLFSGRDRADLFDMEPFGRYEHRGGLTFVTEGGRIRYRATCRHNDPFRFLRDVGELDLGGFDVVMTDFEPVSAWAARRAGVPSVGIGHQYAFGPPTPMRGGNPLTRALLRNFAPVDVALGLHWHPYAANVLPPILDLPSLPLRDDGFVLVYLPFEHQVDVTRLLQGFPERRFVQFARGLQRVDSGNVALHQASTGSFKRHLAACSGVICNSGFELISECLQWQKPVLTRPLRGQLEQLSNALALQQLGYATVTDALCADVLAHWLSARPRPPVCRFDDVAGELARWLSQGRPESPQALAASLWGASPPPQRHPGAAIPGPAAVPG